MTNKEALALFKDHKYMTDFSWQDEMSEIAIKALEKPDVVDVLMKFFSEEPCNYNCMDDKTDEWCAEHCCAHIVRECWEHAIKERWYE